MIVMKTNFVVLCHQAIVARQSVITVCNDLTPKNEEMQYDN